MASLLEPRRLFSSSSSNSSSKAICELPDSTILQNPATAPLAGTWDFFTVSEVVTGASAALTLVIILALMARHATHLSRPNEQLNILRIASYLPILAVGSLVRVAAPPSFIYLDPWLDLAQAVALCNFFLLMCQFVSPSNRRREMFFAGLPASSTKKKSSSSARRQQQENNYNDADAARQEGLRSYRRMWLMIFQYPIVSLLVAVFTAITEAAGVYCLTSSSAHFAHLWLNLAHVVSLFMAVLTSLRLCNSLRKQLAHHRPLAKLLAFKALVALEIVVEIVYWVLRSLKPSPFHPTATLSWFDLYAGIPTMIIAVATVPFALFFWYAYPVTPYYLENVNRNVPIAHQYQHDMDLDSDLAQVHHLRNGSSSNNNSNVDEDDGLINHTAKFPRRADHNMPAMISSAGSSYQGGFLGYRAWMGMLNPSEFLSGLVFGFTMLSKGRNQERQ